MSGNGSFSEVLFQYFGSGIILVLAVLGICYWARQRGKIKYVLCALLIVVALCNEGTYLLAKKLGEGRTMYRFLWMIPATLFAAYFVIEMAAQLQGWKRITLVILCAVAVLLNLSSYSTNWLQLPSNIYQLDDETIAIADTIEEHVEQYWEEQEVDYLTTRVRVGGLDSNSYVGRYIREYSDLIILMDNTDAPVKVMLRDVNGVYSQQTIEEMMVNCYLNYLVVDKKYTEGNERIQSTEIQLIGETDNYDIYFCNYWYLYDKWNYAEAEG